MNPDTTDVLQRFERVCATHYASWHIGELEVLQGGLEALVCKAHSTAFGPVVIKIPWSRWVSNDNDAGVDNRALLQQEVMLASHLAASHIAVPRVYAFHQGSDDFDFIVSAFIEHDLSVPDDCEFGALMSRIHACPPPAFAFAMQGQTPLSFLLAERLTRRLEVVRRISGLPLALAPASEIQRLLARCDDRRCILHMDARPANILTQNGHVRAIIDWSNALLGEPALDLARIAEYGHLSPAFLAGYGVQDCFSHLPEAVELLYRLDTAAMLAVVFLSELDVPDLQQGQAQVRRVDELCSALRAHGLAP